MKIALLGVGSLGSAYGSFLCNAGYDIVGLTRRMDHSIAINENGIRVNRLSKSKVFKLKTSNNPAILSDRDLIIIMVKTYDTETVANLIKKYSSPNSILLTLQSGVGNKEILAKICGESRVLAGLSYFGATKISDNEVEMGENVHTVIAELNGKKSQRLIRIADILKTSGIDVDISLNVNEIIWDKMIVITAQHGLSAITNYTFGQMLESEYCKKIVKNLLIELENVARDENITISQDPLAVVLDNWASIPNHRSSMWKDLQCGRKTEVDAINGAIVKLGAKHNLPTPYNEFMTNIIHILEEKRNRDK